MITTAILDLVRAASSTNKGTGLFSCTDVLLKFTYFAQSAASTIIISKHWTRAYATHIWPLQTCRPVADIVAYLHHTMTSDSNDLEQFDLTRMSS
jgi:hypothetical protein